MLRLSVGLQCAKALETFLLGHPVYTYLFIYLYIYLLPTAIGPIPGGSVT
jgi:hypothetical protein